MGKMNSEFARLRAMSRPRFFGYMALVGASAGLLAWLVVLSGHFVFGINKPSSLALLLAIPRGSLYAVILGLVLRWYWNRRRS